MIAASACVYLMTHFNVVTICPSLTITREELDDVLSIADEYYAQVGY